MFFFTKRWILSALVAATVGAGLGLTGLAPFTASAGVSHSHLYTHSSSSCATHVDPINVFFYYSGFASWVDAHAGHHGGWTHNDGSDQWFAAHGCRRQDQQAASNSGSDPGGRYHMRIGYGYTSTGGSDLDSTWRYWSAADAHHEDAVQCDSIPWPDVEHAVDDKTAEPPGGFDRGRNDVYKNWVRNGGHVFGLSQYWGNTAPFTQCNGNVAWSDGWVYPIKVTTSS